MLIEGVAVGLLALLVGVTGLGVVDRYVLGLGLVWTEELARYALVWLSALAAVVAMRRQAHFKVEALSGRFGRRYAIGLTAVTLVLCAVFVWYGARLAVFFDGQRSPALGVPMSWIYASVPVAFLGMAWYLVRDLVLGAAAAVPAPERDL